MEQPHPMDRLVCGDVGFGKTEVAIRAAFKAVGDGKQVAVLVPTTVLAMQHYKTFRDRLDNFPVTVEYINRFKIHASRLRKPWRVAEGKTDISHWHAPHRQQGRASSRTSACWSLTRSRSSG